MRPRPESRMVDPERGPRCLAANDSAQEPAEPRQHPRIYAIMAQTLLWICQGSHMVYPLFGVLRCFALIRPRLEEHLKSITATDLFKDHCRQSVVPTMADMTPVLTVEARDVRKARTKLEL